jgi:hypothetical protein
MPPLNRGRKKKCDGKTKAKTADNKFSIDEIANRKKKIDAAEVKRAAFP